MVGYPQLEDVVANAMVVHFVYGELHSFQVKFSEDGVPVEDPVNPVAELPNGMPNHADAFAWLGYMKQNNCILGDLIVARAQKGWLGFPGARPGTIGE